MKLFSWSWGGENTRSLKRIEAIVKQINALESEIETLSDEELAQKTNEFKKRLENESLDDLLPGAFAVVREAAKRTLKQRHFDVQLMGGIALHQGNIAEMKTGEGKTLSATLPAYLNALTGKGVHVVTVNDYLSRRDAVWMGQVYASLGLSVGVINDQTSYIYDPGHIDKDAERDETGAFRVVYEFLRPCERREAYAADITYGTNNQFGFDYLRDNTVYNPSAIRQREHAFAIVDEIDSILIDEARTPLIISAPAAESEDFYKTFADIARKFNSGSDYVVDEKLRAVTLTDDGIEKAERILGIDNIYTDKGIKHVHHLETAVRAKALFERDKEYVVRDGQIVIVDEFTGRLQPGRRWAEGLHQAIEAKEGVSIQRESRTVASITFQNYFRMYDKLSGMTGTASTSQEEFYKVYGLNVIVIPPNVPSKRLDKNDLIFQTEEGKFKAIARTVREVNKKGQPVLIGTVSIEKNELLSAYLKREGVAHEILNAKNHEREGEIIAQAGRKGSVTIATNMAGRGVDIKLGGSPGSPEAYEEVKSSGGLFVVGTERHEARRIDNQLRGRSGRQGDPGETQFFVSLEDSLMRVFASGTIKGMMGRFGIPEDQPIENKLITRSLETAQTRIEGHHFDSRKIVLEYDDVLNHQRNAVYERRRRILMGTAEQLDTEVTVLTEGDEKMQTLLHEKKESLGDDEYYSALRRLFLQAIDMLWIEHLEVMEYTRGSVNLRAYGQRDPLLEYRKEGLRLFKEMQESANDVIVRMLPNIGVSAFQAQQQGELRLSHLSPQVTVPRIVRRSAGQRKIGRNEVVKITNGTETKEMKFKRAEPLLTQGEWKLVEEK
jgi:preprotein translocase subunit SecA